MTLEVADDLVKWRQLNQPFEGRVRCMYLDVKGLVTCGVGNLIDTPAAALRLKWRKPDGTVATPAEVTAEWHRVKASEPARRAAYYTALTSLRLDDSEIDRLVDAQLFANERWLRKHYVPDAEWCSWPADAQLVALSLAWALGAGWPGKAKWRPLWALLRARKWLEAREYVDLETRGNAGVAPRNAANRVMLTNAEAVDRTGSDPDVLHWPAALTPPADEPTVPAVPHPAESPPELLAFPEVDWNDLRKDHSWRKY